MNYNDVNVIFRTYWRFKLYHNLEVTKCKKIIDIKRRKLLKYNNRGFFIDGKYYKRSDINSMVERIPKSDILPFNLGLKSAMN